MPKKNYVNNITLREELIKHFETEIISDKLHFIILDMCKRIGSKPNFCNYTYIQDMIFDAYTKCIGVISRKKFNIERQNAFAYFTTVIHNSFTDKIGKEWHHRNTKKQLKEQIYNNLYERYRNIDHRMITEEGISSEE